MTKDNQTSACSFGQINQHAGRTHQRLLRRDVGVLAVLIAGAASIIMAAAPAHAGATSTGAIPLDQRIADHASRNGVPVAFARAMIRKESRFNPRAMNAGNYGLMQIRLGTARAMGYRGGAAGLLDAETNLTYGMRYLGKAWKLAGGDVCGAVLRYQAGLDARRQVASTRRACGFVKVAMAGD
jgi:soluble lytic murein transglycosylase-like protein